MQTVWLKIYGPGWEQCVKADKVDWSDASVEASLHGERVLFVHLASVDGIFVTHEKPQK